MLLKSFTVLCFIVFIAGCMQLLIYITAFTFLSYEDLWKHLQEAEGTFLK